MYWIHRLTIFLLRGPVYLFLRLRVNYRRHRPGRIAGPFVVVSNHNTDLDPLLVISAFRQHMYAVGSEHIFRRGFVTALLKFFFDPVARPKGSRATVTAIEMLRRLREGRSLLLFAEGNRSYNGLTMPIEPATGKLLKKAGCSLVTFRLTGGYFTSPRWSGASFRRGRLDGGVVRVYSPEELAAMSAEQVNAAIFADIFEDAYAEQAVRRIRYRGRKLAEGIGTALFLCPRCERVGTVYGRGGEILCPCGLRGTYDEYGDLSGNFPFTSVRDWDLWQKPRLLARVRAGSDEVYWTEEADLRLLSVTPRVGAAVVDHGPLSISGRVLRCGGTEIPVAAIQNVSIHGPSALVLTVEGMGYLEIPADPVKYRGRIFWLVIDEIKCQLAAPRPGAAPSA